VILYSRLKAFDFEAIMIDRILEKEQSWPALPFAEWKDTCATLHMWTQIVGKVRLAQSPLINHWWEVPLYVYARGLTTSAIPCPDGTFDVTFDFIDHRLDIKTSRGESRTISLYHRTVAGFYREFREMLRSLRIEVKIWPMPVEIPNPIRFDQDVTHAKYDPVYANRFWRILVTIDAIFKEFRGRFIGKASPVHFFWGSFDLAVTRFSGRRAPRHPGGVPHLSDEIACEAYSHEESSAGFWPGSGAVDYPAFYSYAYPEPAGFRATRVRPDAAFFHEALGEFILPYDAVRTAASPEQALLEFLQSTYEAAANAAKWDRDALECAPGQPGVVRQV
jgi:hypothetical protein